MLKSEEKIFPKFIPSQCVMYSLSSYITPYTIVNRQLDEHVNERSHIAKKHLLYKIAIATIGFS